jgi:hypothetical protein
MGRRVAVVVHIGHAIAAHARSRVLKHQAREIYTLFFVMNVAHRCGVGASTLKVHMRRGREAAPTSKLPKARDFMITPTTPAPRVGCAKFYLSAGVSKTKYDVLSFYVSKPLETQLGERHGNGLKIQGRWSVVFHPSTVSSGTIGCASPILTFL